jgi:ribosomal protein L5
MRTTRLDYYTNYKTNYDLIDKFFLKSVFEMPKLKKIILNMGQTDCKKESILSVILALELITGQQGSPTKSKKTLLV